MTFEEWCKYNPYFPVYNPISMTYWLVPSKVLREIFTKYKDECKSLRSLKDKEN